MSEVMIEGRTDYIMEVLGYRKERDVMGRVWEEKTSSR